MLETELTAELGYEKYASEGRNIGNSRTPLLEQHGASNRLEQKTINLYAKGISARDIQDTMQDLYGIEVSAGTISRITDKVWTLVEEWQNCPVESIYPIISLDGLYVKLHQEGKVENSAVYVVMGIDLEGHRDILGQGVSKGNEGANFWLSVLSDLQAWSVEDVFIASVDGLKGFNEAIQSVVPLAAVQQCVVHQIRNSLKYVPWEDRKVVANDPKKIYKAPTREEAETELLSLAENWQEIRAVLLGEP